MDTNIESLTYNPPYKVELKDRTVQYTPEGTSIQNIYALSDYAYNREVVKVLTGGVSINNNKVRVFPKQDSYYNEYCYCLDCDVRALQPDTFNGNTSMQSDTEDWITAHQKANAGVVDRYSPIMWWSKHVPSGGALIAANYRSIRGYYKEEGQLDFDFVEPAFTFNGNAVSVDSWDLGWRYENEVPEYYALNTDTVGYVTECILGFSVKRIMVPDYQFRLLQQNVIPLCIGKINSTVLEWPINQNRGEGTPQFRFPAECLRFDNCEATPHIDAYGAIYWTLDYQFSVNYNLGAPMSGFEMQPIGWNALYNPRIKAGLYNEHAGWMRVSTAPGFFDRTDAWFGGGGQSIPPQNHSLYVTTTALDTLFINFD